MRVLRSAPLDLVVALSASGLLLVACIFQSIIADHDPSATQLDLRLAPPGFAGHLLGTDDLGRDVWSRILAGLQWSLGVAVAATLLSALLGTGLGLTAAESSGAARVLVRQSIDTILSFPSLIVAVCVVTLVGNGFWPLTFTLALLTWPIFARVVYAEAMSLRQRDYAIAAQLFGVGRMVVLWRHILPGLRPTLLVMVAFHFADMLIAESALSFLGLGAPLDAPTLGNMLAASRDKMIIAPWLLLAPAGAIVLVVVVLNLLGDALAAAFRRRGRDLEV